MNRKRNGIGKITWSIWGDSIKRVIKIIAVVLAFCLLPANAFIERAYAAKSVDQIIEEANDELQFPGYFSLTNRNGKRLITEYVTDGFPVNGVTGSEHAILFVYGSPSGDVKNGQHRYLGETINGTLFPNPNFPPDVDPGLGLTNTSWYTTAEIFYSDNNLIRRFIPKPPNFSSFDLIPRDAEEVIIPENLLDLHPQLVRRADELGLSDYAYVIQPPTTYAWGLVIFFHETSLGTFYTTALVLPYILQEGDLEAHIIDHVSSANPGENVSLSFLVASTFAHDIEGTKYELQCDGVTVRSGTLDITDSASAVIPYDFTMPEYDVTVRFAVNEGRENPGHEENWDNNIVAFTIAAGSDVDTEGEIVFDYNILEKNIRFDLGTANATLTLPRGSWIDAATGSLIVTNDTPLIYKDFTVERNPAVNEWSASITRTPLIHTLLRRQDFGDNPIARVYGATNTKTGQASASGSVSRRYEYDCGGCRGPRDDRYCPGHRSTTTASFNRIVHRNNITVNVYNGLAAISPPLFQNQVDHNDTSSLLKKLWWTSAPIELDVVRLMYYQSEDGALYNKTPVDGRYKRSFIEQNEGELRWGITSRLQSEYANDRNKARGRSYDLQGDEKAVFASDLRFRDVTDYYPIRSGYFFNPTGTYTFLLTTQIYKDSPDDTPEHKALVDAMIAAFRYESDMVYINSARQAVTIGGGAATKSGTAFSATRGVVTTGHHPYFDVTVERDYNKIGAEELRHDYRDVLYETGGVTDNRFKAVLEGYAESGTLSSRSSSKYVEYVHEDEEVYKITETTRVTITVNPDNTKLYTHAQMRNGDYRVRAYIDSVALGPLTYGHLTTLAGIIPLDEISVKVVGSMYDDAR